MGYALLPGRPNCDGLSDLRRVVVSFAMAFSLAEVDAVLGDYVYGNSY